MVLWGRGGWCGKGWIRSWHMERSKINSEKTMVQLPKTQLHPAPGCWETDPASITSDGHSSWEHWEDLVLPQYLLLSIYPWSVSPSIYNGTPEDIKPWVLTSLTQSSSVGAEPLCIFPYTLNDLWMMHNAQHMLCTGSTDDGLGNDGRGKVCNV